VFCIISEAKRWNGRDIYRSIPQDQPKSEGFLTSSRKVCPRCQAHAPQLSLGEQYWDMSRTGARRFCGGDMQENKEIKTQRANLEDRDACPVFSGGQEGSAQ
jgi:hypothetical protein